MISDGVLGLRAREETWGQTRAINEFLQILGADIHEFTRLRFRRVTTGLTGAAKVTSGMYGWRFSLSVVMSLHERSPPLHIGRKILSNRDVKIE